MKKKFYFRRVFINSIRTVPKSIEVFKRLLKRFPEHHPYIKVITDQLKFADAGYHGETYVDHFLNQIEFPTPHVIFKGLHIQINPNSYLQIDTLIITKKYIAILEIKNIKGKVIFQTNPKQLVREINGEITTFKCPEQQIVRHYRKLQFILSKLNIDIPVEQRIVFAFSSTHIAQPPENIKVLMGCDISNHLDLLNQLPDIISTTEFKKLKNFLNKNHLEFVPRPLHEIYPFDFNHLKTGIFCSSCEITLTNENRCPTCKTSRKSLQKQAIEEWFYLCKNTISNKECVFYLNLKNKFDGSYVLKKFNLAPKSSSKYRHYTYSESFWLVKKE